MKPRARRTRPLLPPLTPETDPIALNNRPDAPGPKPKPRKALQFMVSPEVFEAFSAEAGRRFGFQKGAKTQLFAEMWEEHAARAAQEK